MPTTVEVACALEAWGDRRGWAGTDPYDGLNAGSLAAPAKRSALGRRLLTQLVKRCPLDLRPLLGIEPGVSAAALANVASAYARDGFLPAEESTAKLQGTLARLEQLRAPGFDQPCWGYHFDVQTRVFFYPRGAPNVIATSFAGNALLDGHEATGDPSLLERAVGVGDFLLDNIPQTEDAPGAYFGYLVGDRTPIHNASMLVCALLARLARHSGRTDFAEAAARGVAYTLARQGADGSWPYGERPHLRWIDNYHTGYVLEALLVCVDAGLDVDLDAWRRGVDYYQRELFRADGAPRYFAGSLYPIDIQCVTQGIQTFARAARREPVFAAAAGRVFDYGVQRMRRRDGAFAFQRRRLWTSGIPHVRWGQAPMLLALTFLLELERDRA